MRVSTVSALSIVGLALFAEAVPFSARGINHKDGRRLVPVGQSDSDSNSGTGLEEFDTPPAKVVRAERQNADAESENFDQSEADVEAENTLSERMVVNLGQSETLGKEYDQRVANFPHLVTLTHTLEQLTPGTPEYDAKKKEYDSWARELTTRDADSEPENLLSERAESTAKETAIKNSWAAAAAHRAKVAALRAQLKTMKEGTEEYKRRQALLSAYYNSKTPFYTEYANTGIQN